MDCGGLTWQRPVTVKVIHMMTMTVVNHISEDSCVNAAIFSELHMIKTSGVKRTAEDLCVKHKLRLL